MFLDRTLFHWVINLFFKKMPSKPSTIRFKTSFFDAGLQESLHWFFFDLVKNDWSMVPWAKEKECTLGREQCVCVLFAGCYLCPSQLSQKNFFPEFFRSAKQCNKEKVYSPKTSNGHQMWGMTVGEEGKKVPIVIAMNPSKTSEYGCKLCPFANKIVMVHTIGMDEAHGKGDLHVWHLFSPTSSNF